MPTGKGSHSGSVLATTQSNRTRRCRWRATRRSPTRSGPQGRGSSGRCHRSTNAGSGVSATRLEPSGSTGRTSSRWGNSNDRCRTVIRARLRSSSRYAERAAAPRTRRTRSSEPMAVPETVASRTANHGTPPWRPPTCTQPRRFGDLPTATWSKRHSQLRTVVRFPRRSMRRSPSFPRRCSGGARWRIVWTGRRSTWPRRFCSAGAKVRPSMRW